MTHCTSDADKSREQLIREVSTLRSRLVLEKQRQRRLLDSMQEGFGSAEIVRDENGNPIDLRLLEVNRALGRIMGMPAEHAVGKTARQLFPKLDPGWIKMICDAALVKKVVQTDGWSPSLNKWCTFRAFVTEDARDAPLTFYVAETNKVEEALRQSNERFSLAAKAARMGTYSRNFQTGEDYWSPEFKSLLGLGPDDPLPLRDGIPAAVHPADHEKVATEVHTCLEDPGKPEFSTMHRVVFPDGEPHWMMLRGRVEFDLQGRPLQKHAVMMDITERICAEESLRESEELFRIMANGLPLLVWVHDADGRQQFVNQTFLEFFGVTSGEINGERWQLLWHPDDVAAYSAEFLSCVRERRAFHAQARVRRSDGAWAWIESWGRPRLSASGKLLGFVGASADITERRRAEEALCQSEERYRMVNQATDDIIWDWDLASDIVTWNKAVEPAVGRSRAEMPPTVQGWYDHIHPDDSQRVIASIHRVIESRRNNWNDEYRFGPVGGPYRTYYDRGLIARDAGGRAYRMIGSMVDLTERKKAEEVLHQRVEELQTMMDVAPVAILISRDPHCDKIKGNRTANILYEVGERENVSANAHGARRFFRHGKELRPEELPMQMAATHNMEIANAEMDILLPTGKLLNMLGSASPLRDRQGNVRGCIGAFMDITERKKAEEKLRHWNETLEQRVAERTALAEARAKQLQALAVELIEAEEQEKHRLAELLHDDLQQIMAAARLHLESVCEELPHIPLLQEVEQMFSDCITKARHLSHQLSPAVFYHCDLSDALKWLCQQMREQFGLKVNLQAKAAKQCGNMPLKVFMIRALQELLFNVVKHAGVKTARMALSSTGDQVVVTVSDKGHGFNPAILDSIPEKAGLGLLSLRERASYVGGHLAIASAPGRGSRFKLTLPLGLTESEDRKVEEFPPTAARTAGETPKPGKIRVLFADDHKVMRQGLIRLISAQPDIHVVGEASNGREALERAYQLKPDVIVMDVSMPIMDGVEATRCIKAALPGVRVIGLSMHEDRHICQAMCDAGAETFVSKAASSAILLKAIYGIAGPASPP